MTNVNQFDALINMYQYYFVCVCVCMYTLIDDETGTTTTLHVCLCACVKRIQTNQLRSMGAGAELCCVRFTVNIKTMCYAFTQTENLTDYPYSNQLSVFFTFNSSAALIWNKISY